MRSTIFAALALSTVSSVALAQTSTAPATPNTMNKTESSAKPAGATTTTGNPAAGTNTTAGTNNTGMNNAAGTTAAGASKDSTAATMDAKKSAAETTGMKTDSSMGMRVANTATVAVKYVTVSPADFMTSNLVGSTVYNNQKESVGEVEDLVIDNGQKVTGVVVSVGGFLGMGESYVVLDPSTMVINKQDGNWVAYVDTNKETLKNAPKFTYPKSKS